MSGTNPPSSAATARALEATQNLKRSVQAAFDGTIRSFPLLCSSILFLFGHEVISSLNLTCFLSQPGFHHLLTKARFVRNS